jgi:hypothetical protein
MFLWKGITSVSIGFPVCQLEMQALLPQPSEACKAYLDSNVQEAAQEGK